MAALKFIATVVDVNVRVGEKDKFVKKGESCPDGVDVKVRDALVRMGLLTPSEAPERGAPADTATAAATPVEPQVLVFAAGQVPKDSDTRKVWEAYAAAAGVDISDAKTKDDVVAAVKTSAPQPPVTPQGD